MFIRYQLLTHVKTKHNMTITAYNKAHMQLHNVEYGESNILDKGRKIGTQKAPQWCDGTMYKCPYCFNIYYRYFTFRIHLINSHKMTDTEERSICVRENEIVTDIYRCKICSTQVKRDRMDIEAHLKQAHKTTLKIYSANFENPSIKDSAKEVVDRLVRMGVLEEPSKSVCRTPKKLKPRPAVTEVKSESSIDVVDQENINKFISVSESVANDDNHDEEDSAQVNVKTEVAEGSYSQSQVENHEDNNDDSTRKGRKRRLPSKFTSDFEVELTPGRGVQRRGEETPGSSSVLTRRGSNTPLRHDDDSAPPANKHVKRSSEDKILYKCPLHPCSWSCSKTEMKTGPAVLHLLKVHKIQPLEMRERGIKFDKIQL